MYPALTYAVAALLGVVAVLALVALKKPELDGPARLAMKGAHGATVLVVVLAAIELLQGYEPKNMVTYVGYMVASAGLPLILLNQRGEIDEKGKPVLDADGHPVQAPPPHLAVLTVCAIAMVVLVVRLQGIH
ncbi:hypothetical protein [Nocardioides yefusunii]|uniref:Integral membrane protein n=1 Tax=Nocardioides yefusunii TaxID=2500546 RepID=A0ABW1QUR6_9ACTN|nr:hypothetical protein [Nocardioides yefusunii]